PGVGKSRLFWEFTHSDRVHGWLIVQSSSVSYGKATAYLPVIDLLRGYFQIEARDNARQVRERITGKVLWLDRALEPALPALLALLDVATDDEAWTRLDSLFRGSRFRMDSGLVGMTMSVGTTRHPARPGMVAPASRGVKPRCSPCHPPRPAAAAPPASVAMLCGARILLFIAAAPGGGGR